MAGAAAASRAPTSRCSISVGSSGNAVTSLFHSETMRGTSSTRFSRVQYPPLAHRFSNADGGGESLRPLQCRAWNAPCQRTIRIASSKVSPILHAAASAASLSTCRSDVGVELKGVS
jgi:hypothetical protein